MMKMMLVGWFCMFGFLPWAMAAVQELPTWTPHPVLRKEVKGRSQVRIVDVSSNLKEIDLYPPSVGRDPAQAKLTIPMTKEGAALMVHNAMGNYHWISAQSMDQKEEFTWGSVHFFSMPGPSPSVMLTVPKSRLEIIPQPLPREHSTYRAEETWAFLVRFDQRALPNELVTFYAPMQLEQRFFTDDQGVVLVRFPSFPTPKATQTPPVKTHRRPVQPFQLAVEWQTSAKRFVTVFQYEYGPSPLFNRHPFLGWMVAGLGMAGGVLLWRPRQGSKA
ncbi:MAG: hypothetical protein H7839_06470 [Magnetococcus sp. YQC-5]